MGHLLLFITLNQLKPFSNRSSVELIPADGFPTLSNRNKAINL